MNRILDNPFYYLENFHRVLDWLGSRYRDLLDEEEARFIAAFPALPQPARALFVRMVMRKGTVFRAAKLNYPEIGCPQEAAAALLPTGWIAADPELTLEELFDLLTKAELARLFGLPAQARKGDQLQALRASYADARPFSAWMQDGAEQVYRVLAQPLCDRLRLLFFGNAHQDWSEFVLSDLGIYKFEPVEFSPSSRGFRSRQDVERYLALQRCKERFHAGEPPAAIRPDLPVDDGTNPWLTSRRARLLFQFAQHDERLQDWPAAYNGYIDCGYPGARARAVRVLEKDGRYAEAQLLLDTAMRAPASDAERQHLARIAPRLGRKLGRAAARPVKAFVERIDLQLPMPSDDGWRVEGVVRDHLQRPGAPVFYVENALINALFGLLCWRAIFMPIPGAFFHPFHHGPADLHSADFFQRRAAAFDACFAELEDGRYRDTILRTYAGKAGIQSPFLIWDLLSGELLQLALDCIPAAHLRCSFARIVADVQANRSGFPDLIQFWPDEKRYRMVEVKGPGDRLQDNQLRWIAYCAEHAMPVAVCYLQWQ